MPITTAQPSVITVNAIAPGLIDTPMTAGLGSDERAERFIEQQHFRVQHQGAHQTYALLLASGKLDRKTIQGIDGEVRELGEFGNARRDTHIRPAQISRHQRYIVARTQVWK